MGYLLPASYMDGLGKKLTRKDKTMPCLCGDPYCQRCFPGNDGGVGENYRVETWYDTDPNCNCPQAVPSRLVWYWRIVGETADYGGVVTECDHGYSTEEEARTEGELMLSIFLQNEEENFDETEDSIGVAPEAESDR